MASNCTQLQVNKNLTSVDPDFILVYQTNQDSDEKIETCKEGEKGLLCRLRKRFEVEGRRKGLVIETFIYRDFGFMLVWAPFYMLCQEAEKLNFKVQTRIKLPLYSKKKMAFRPEIDPRRGRVSNAKVLAKLNLFKSLIETKPKVKQVNLENQIQTSKTDPKPTKSTGKTSAKSTGKKSTKSTGKTSAKSTGKKPGKPTGKAASKPSTRPAAKPAGKEKNKTNSNISTNAVLSGMHAAAENVAGDEVASISQQKRHSDIWRRRSKSSSSYTNKANLNNEVENECDKDMTKMEDNGLRLMSGENYLCSVQDEFMQINASTNNINQNARKDRKNFFLEMAGLLKETFEDYFFFNFRQSSNIHAPLTKDNYKFCEKWSLPDIFFCRNARNTLVFSILNSLDISQKPKLFSKAEKIIDNQSIKINKCGKKNFSFLLAINAFQVYFIFNNELNETFKENFESKVIYRNAHKPSIPLLFTIKKAWSNIDVLTPKPHPLKIVKKIPMKKAVRERVDSTSLIAKLAQNNNTNKHALHKNFDEAENLNANASFDINGTENGEVKSKKSNNPRPTLQETLRNPLDQSSDDPFLRLGIQTTIYTLFTKMAIVALRGSLVLAAMSLVVGLVYVIGSKGELSFFIDNFFTPFYSFSLVFWGVFLWLYFQSKYRMILAKGSNHNILAEEALLFHIPQKEPSKKRMAVYYLFSVFLIITMSLFPILTMFLRLILLSSCGNGVCRLVVTFCICLLTAIIICALACFFDKFCDGYVKLEHNIRDRSYFRAIFLKKIAFHAYNWYSVCIYITFFRNAIAKTLSKIGFPAEDHCAATPEEFDHSCYPYLAMQVIFIIFAKLTYSEIVYYSRKKKIAKRISKFKAMGKRKDEKFVPDTKENNTQNNNEEPSSLKSNEIDLGTNGNNGLKDKVFSKMVNKNKSNTNEASSDSSEISRKVTNDFILLNENLGNCCEVCRKNLKGNNLNKIKSNQAEKKYFIFASNLIKKAATRRLDESHSIAMPCECMHPKACLLQQQFNISNNVNKNANVGPKPDSLTRGNQVMPPILKPDRTIQEKELKETIREIMTEEMLKPEMTATYLLDRLLELLLVFGMVVLFGGSCVFVPIVAALYTHRQYKHVINYLSRSCSKPILFVSQGFELLHSTMTFIVFFSIPVNSALSAFSSSNFSSLTMCQRMSWFIRSLMTATFISLLLYIFVKDSTSELKTSQNRGAYWLNEIMKSKIALKPPPPPLPPKPKGFSTKQATKKSLGKKQPEKNETTKKNPSKIASTKKTPPKKSAAMKTPTPKTQKKSPTAKKK